MLKIIGATKIIGAPPIKESTVSVPGSDLTLDFTEAFGGVHFKNREISMTFLSLEPWSNQMAQDSTVKNALHGRKLDVVFSDDSAYYWRGRISVGGWEYYKGAGRLKVEIDAEPYKRKISETVVTSSGNETVALENSRMPVVPRISTDGDVTLSWGDYSVALAAGDDQIIPQLVLEQGETEVEITGAANVEFKYEEGAL